MVITNGNMNLEISESELMVEEFRQKLIFTLKQERVKIKEKADAEAKQLISKAYEDSATVTKATKDEAFQILSRARQEAEQNAERTLSQANQKVEELFEEARETIRKEAREKTKKETESLLSKAREEAGKISAKTLQSAREEAAALISDAKKDAAAMSKQIVGEADKRVEEITAEAREMKRQAEVELADIRHKTQIATEKALSNIRDEAAATAQKEVQEILAQARQKAQKDREFLLSTTLSEAKNDAEKERLVILQKARAEADEIISKAKTRMKSQIEESSRLMQEIQQRMQQVIGGSQQFMPVEPVPVVKSEPTIEPPINTPVQNVRMSEETQKHISELLQDNNNSNANRTYRGKLRIDIAPPADSEGMKTLEKELLAGGIIRIVAKGGSGDGSAWIEVDIPQPQPLLDILEKIPSVKDVVGAKSYVIVALKTRQLV